MLLATSAGASAAISSSVFYLERSQQAEGLESLSIRLSVTITEGTLAQGAASTAVLEDPAGGLHAITGSARSGSVSFAATVPLETLADAGGVWKLTVNEGAGADEDLRITVPTVEMDAFPVYPAFPKHPYEGDASKIRFVWNTAASAISTAGGSVVSTGNGSAVYGYTPGGPRQVDVSHIQSINGATIANPDGTPRGPVTTQSLQSQSWMEVFTDAEPRELAGQTTTTDGVHEFFASGLVKGGRYAVLGRTGEGAWEEIYRFVAVSNAHVYEEEQGEEPRSFMIEADPNRAPVAEPAALAVVEDTPLPVTLYGSDADGDAFVFEIVTPPTKGVIDSRETGWFYVPNANVTGADEFTFRVNDGSERSAYSEPATVSIFISPVNDVPVATGGEFFTMKGGTFRFTLPGMDVDGDAMTFQVIDQPEKGKLTGTPPNLTYKAAKPGEWTFRYTVSDGQTTSAPGIITLRVRAENAKPVAQPSSVVAHMGQPLLLPLTGLDTDQDPLSFSITKKPKTGTLTGTPPAVYYTPKPGYRGTDSVSYVANDGKANSKPAVIQITVINPNNRAPVASSFVALGPPVKKVVPVVLSATDADGDPVTYRLLTQPENGKLTGKVPNLKFKPANGFTGTASFSYVANDGTVDSAPATVTIPVGEVNLPAPAASFAR
ncbi:Ig-like domain-containing protein [Luteolibacter flavescens]|uniref:Ig-like domain-containing protein n=1 Tax=Luteolibacter flavescens TaxID=1859460 RepID=A0ABT3FM91_9BACT|nr:Ig-like domain-containing protein [Luteolibacter flavescens]MCW1884687.1 Ig-like domain-containing protein [Luteolibacter flavescens]